MKEVKYIGFYSLKSLDQDRVCSLAAVNKMDYISDAINQIGYLVHIISPSWYVDNTSKIRYKKSKTVHVHHSKQVTFCPSFTTKTCYLRWIRIILSMIWLFYWLVINTKRGEKIIVYHTPWIAIPIILAKVIKGFKIILEVEELYSDVSNIGIFKEICEYTLIHSAHSYILSTELLKTKVKTKKQSIILYGIYKVFPKIAYPPLDGKIHLLYAGIIDIHKAGAFKAVEAARYLSDLYVLHIVGFGKTELLISLINEVNQAGGCKVYFDGSLDGTEFIEYCQRCHIGLSTQSMEGKYLDSSFPSKILTYLCMGLNVISGEILCVKDSKIGKFVNFYQNDDPKLIADVIKNIKLFNDKEIQQYIYELNLLFLEELKGLITNK